MYSPLIRKVGRDLYCRGSSPRPVRLQNDVVDNDTSIKKTYHRRYDTVPANLADFETELVSIDSATPGTWCQHADGALAILYQNGF